MMDEAFFPSHMVLKHLWGTIIVWTWYLVQKQGFGPRGYPNLKSLWWGLK